MSLGGRGARYTIGSRGKRVTLGLPGTGLFYTKTESRSKTKKSTKEKTNQKTNAIQLTEQRLDLGFFKHLMLSENEKSFIGGCRLYIRRNIQEAYQQFQKSAKLADGAFMAGFLALKQEEYNNAETYFLQALQNSKTLGKYFDKYQLDISVSLPITEEIAASIVPGERGIMLALVEVYQKLGKPKEAVQYLKKMRKLDSDDIIVKISLAEILYEAAPMNKKYCQEIVKLADGVTNSTAMDSALLLYKAKALRQLGMPHAAEEVIKAALSRKKDRSDELLRALRYERAIVYEEIGKKSQARTEWEKLYAESPDYEDIASRLNL